MSQQFRHQCRHHHTFTSTPGALGLRGYLRGLRPMPPPGDFSKSLKKSDFWKIGNCLLKDRFLADLGLKFGFCVKNCVGTSIQTSISSLFENLVFYKSSFWLFFHFWVVFWGLGASTSNASCKNIPMVWSSDILAWWEAHWCPAKAQVR